MSLGVTKSKTAHCLQAERRLTLQMCDEATQSRSRQRLGADGTGIRSSICSSIPFVRGVAGAMPQGARCVELRQKPQLEAAARSQLAAPVSAHQQLPSTGRGRH